MVERKLEKANQYQQEQIKIIPMEQRPVFHLSSPIGWINDPNGFSHYNEAYHLFYQYHPYSTDWGPMHWGHSVTKDFINWQQMPVALAPDEQYDNHGCFSGSAIEHNGEHILMYTGVTEEGQTQCIAIGDGTTYKKIKENPVITGEMLPSGSSLTDFRDPKMWKEGNTFYTVVASRGEDGSGQIAVFESEDIKTWKYSGILQKCNWQYGAMWECPDFFPLDGKYVLLVSPQDMEAQDLEFHCGNGTLCMIGDFDSVTCQLNSESNKAIDYGLDFYAPQTLLSADGRRIMIAWMQSWDYKMSPAEFKWSGMMTIPRELSVKNEKLIQTPVREIEKYYVDTVIFENVAIMDTLELEGIEGRLLDMTLEVEPGKYELFEIMLAANKKYHTTVSYEPEKSIVTFDRTYSGERRDQCHSRSMRVQNAQGKIKIRVLMDRYSVELFINDGEQAMTSRIYTGQGAKEIHFRTKGSAIFSIVKHGLAEQR